MTKYILVGGYLHKAKDGGRAFCEELVKGFSSDRPVKILDCMFARPIDSWDDKIKEDNVLFSKFINNFELILAEQDKFIEQVKSSDVIFLRGGGTEVFLERLNKVKDWTKELNRKTLAGTSAGADVISKYCYGVDNDKIINCIGLLPIKFIPHWHSESDFYSKLDWEKALQKLKDYREELPVYTLAEGEFKVIVL
ncbi:MAG: Type 1 glutamine amidotransferase-like domain-containing protein [Candidatus Paceibacterota bacterium]